MTDHTQFLSHVREYVTKNPDVAAFISDHVAFGINESRKQTLERAADMEVALSVAIAARYKGRDNLILSKLEKWNGRSALRWDDTIEMLKGSTK